MMTFGMICVAIVFVGFIHDLLNEELVRKFDQTKGVQLTYARVRVKQDEYYPRVFNSRIPSLFN